MIRNYISQHLSTLSMRKHRVCTNMNVLCLIKSRPNNACDCHCLCPMPSAHPHLVPNCPCPPRACAYTCVLTHTMWLSCTAYAHTCLCPYMCPYPHILESVNKHKSCHVLGQGSFWKCNSKNLNPENDLLYNLSLYGMRTWLRKCYSHTGPVLVYWPNIPKSKICKK